ncbi:MAG: tRNA (guanosine(46)-N7)-methyltransferase TrmB [Pseudomonadales bacterium]
MRESKEHARGIKSFVIREGRMTGGQRRALIEYWDDYGMACEGVVEPEKVFGNDAPVVVEIGFGMGDSLFELATSNPDTNYIGIEVHRPGVGHLLIKAMDAGLSNLKVINADSVTVMDKCIPHASIDRIQVFFPDPWHKKRHHKRRLVNRNFTSLLVDRLKPGGLVHIATDWRPYAQAIGEVMLEFPEMTPVEPPIRPVTKYERRGVMLGHKVTDLAWRKVQ